MRQIKTDQNKCLNKNVYLYSLFPRKPAIVDGLRRNYFSDVRLNV